MRLRYLIILVVFVLITIFLPYIVDISYHTENPSIFWSYSQTDILNYITVVIGIIIAILALFISVDENRVKIKFDISSSIDDEGDQCFEFRVINISKVYCKIEQFGLSCMFKPIKIKVFGHTLLLRRFKWQNRMHSVLSDPFELQPNECHDVIIKYTVVKQNIEQFYDKHESVELFVSFVTWKHCYKKANEIRKLLDFNYSEKGDSTNE